MRHPVHLTVSGNRGALSHHEPGRCGGNRPEGMHVRLIRNADVWCSWRPGKPGLHRFAAENVAARKVATIPTRKLMSGAWLEQAPDAGTAMLTKAVSESGPWAGRPSRGAPRTGCRSSPKAYLPGTPAAVSSAQIASMFSAFTWKRRSANTASAASIRTTRWQTPRIFPASRRMSSAVRILAAKSPGKARESKWGQSEFIQREKMGSE